MKINFLRFTLLVTVLSIMLSACKKDKEATPKTECLLARDDKGDGYYETYQYDANRRLTAYSYYVPQSQYTLAFTDSVSIERDSQNRIIKLVADRGVYDGYSTTLEYNAKGQMVKITETAAANSYTSNSSIAEYDSQGFVVKTTTTRNNAYGPPTTQVYRYEYSNGNLVKRTDGQTGEVMSYEYYLDKGVQQSELSGFNSPSGMIWNTPSKNLLKMMTTGGQKWDYIYEYNEKGLVSKSTEQYSYNGTVVSTTVFTHTYTCN